MMDLAVRATPSGSEGLGFSLMMSVRNLCLFGSDWFGSKLLDAYHLQFNTLVIANSVMSGLIVPLVFLSARGDRADAGRASLQLQRGTCGRSRSSDSGMNGSY